MARSKRSLISEVMSRRLVAVSPRTTIKMAIRLLKNANVSMLPVISNERLIGIIDEELLLEFANSKKQNELGDLVETIMKEPIFIEENRSIDDCIGLMLKNSLTRLPIIDAKKSMRCIGMVSATELLAAKTDLQ